MILEILFVMFVAGIAISLFFCLFSDTETFKAIDKYIADCINRQRGAE